MLTLKETSATGINKKKWAIEPITRTIEYHMYSGVELTRETLLWDRYILTILNLEGEMPSNSFCNLITLTNTNNKDMKTIYQSILITLLSALILLCAFTLIGLLLNFWNESIVNASLALLSSLLIGTISYFGLDVLIDKQKHK